MVTRDNLLLKIVFLCSMSDITAPEPSPLDNEKKLMIYNLESKTLKLIDSTVTDVNIFFSPTGAKLYFVKKELEKTRVYSFNLLDQKIWFEFEFASNTIEISDIKWIDENQLIFEITEKNENFIFVDSQILVLDLQEQELVYSSKKLPYDLKVLSVNNTINLNEKPYRIIDTPLG